MRCIVACCVLSEANAGHVLVPNARKLKGFLETKCLTLQASSKWLTPPTLPLQVQETCKTSVADNVRSYRKKGKLAFCTLSFVTMPSLLLLH